MMNDNGYSNSVKGRIYTAITVVLLLFLAYSFFRVQVLESEVYREKSLENSVKIVTQTPVRGSIYDRRGELLVDNRPSFSIYLTRALTNKYTIQFISRLFQINEDQIKKKLRKASAFQPVKIVRFVSLEDLTAIQENLYDLRGVEWKIEPRRYYFYPRSFAHIIGTLGEVDEKEVSKNSDLQPGDVVGKKGIEKSLDAYLRGRKGYKFLKVDALGRTIEEIRTEKVQPPTPGYDLYLTIDARLQEYADSLLGDRVGAIVAIDTRNGEVITMVSKPNYDLNWFSETVDADRWKKLIADTLHPLYDRSCQSSYPPGSTYKLITAIAALNEGIITPNWTVFDPGYFRIGRKILRCWKPDGHGKQNLYQAIKNSCNVYFYKLGLKIGIDLWEKYSKLFLFGQKTGIELNSENPGLVPSRDYYNRVYGEGKWTRGMLANLAIGQGELLVTPLQMARFTMMIANYGEYYQPHLTYRLVDKLTNRIEEVSAPKQKIEGVSREVYEAVRKGMRQVVSGGTGWRAGIIGVAVAGKTGTAQNPHGKSHAWFIGFAPYENPEIAIAVLVENGGAGGSVAAPIAGDFLRRYFYYQGKFDYQKEKRILAEIWKKAQESIAARNDSLPQPAIRDSIR